MPDVLALPSFGPDDVLSMTHQPEAPNRVPDIVKPAAEFLTSGDMAPAHLPRTEPKDYLRELMQNPEIMAKNIEQASQFNFGGMSGRVGRPMVRGVISPTDAPIGGPGLQHTAGAWGKPGADSELLTMLNEGRTFDVIAEKFGVTRNAVAGRAKRLRDAATKAAPEQTDIGTPSLPSFEFMKRSGVATDKEYVNALNRYIEENGYGVKVEQVDHDPFTSTNSAESSRQFAEGSDAFRQGWKDWKKANPFFNRNKDLADAWERGKAKREGHEASKLR